MSQLNGKVAIVTGAGSGIGQASAQAFAEEGAKVVLVDWNAGSGSRTAEQIRADGGEAVFHHADVAQAADAEAMVNLAVEKYGRLDVLLNNAAVQIMGRLTETSEEDWDRLHSVNLKGVFLGCKFAIPVMIRGGGGSVINMASILGFTGDPDLAAYCAMKGGVIALTKAAALTYGPEGVRVNCICPGDVDTPMVQDYFNKEPDPAAARREISQQYAMRRIATPREVARTAVFLASGDSSFTTGAVMVVDGGVTSKCY